MWPRYLLVSLLTMCVANTVTQEEVFAHVRERCGGRETKIGYLLSCPYCFSHWVAFIFVPLFGFKLLEVPYDWGFLRTVIEWFANSLLVVILAAFIRLFFYTADETVGLFRRQVKHTEIAIKEKRKSLERLDRDERADREGGEHRGGEPAPATA